MYLTGVGSSATLVMDGGTTGTSLTKDDSYCVWLIQARCGSPGFMIDSTKTVMADDASFKLFVVEYSDEFTTSVVNTTITLDDSVWWPTTAIPQFYDDDLTTRLSGQPEDLTVNINENDYTSYV